MVRGVSVKESMLANFRDVIARSLLVQTISQHRVRQRQCVRRGSTTRCASRCRSQRQPELASSRASASPIARWWPPCRSARTGKLRWWRRRWGSAGRGDLVLRRLMVLDAQETIKPGRWSSLSGCLSAFALREIVKRLRRCCRRDLARHAAFAGPDRGAEDARNDDNGRKDRNDEPDRPRSHVIAKLAVIASVCGAPMPSPMRVSSQAARTLADHRRRR